MEMTVGREEKDARDGLEITVEERKKRGSER